MFTHEWLKEPWGEWSSGVKVVKTNITGEIRGFRAIHFSILGIPWKHFWTWTRTRDAYSVTSSLYTATPNSSSWNPATYTTHNALQTPAVFVCSYESTAIVNTSLCVRITEVVLGVTVTLVSFMVSLSDSHTAGSHDVIEIESLKLLYTCVHFVPGGLNDVEM